jgi:hypothetical protein
MAPITFSLDLWSKYSLGMSSGTGLTPERGYALSQEPNRQRLKVREFDTDLI